MKARIYHNPACSKSRATLGLLEAAQVELEVVEYLKTPPSKEKLESLLSKLALSPGQLIRKGEPEFKAADLNQAGEAELIELMVAHPKLIERPIVEVGERALIGRPPERVLEFLQ